MTAPDTTEAVMRAIAEPMAEAYGRLQDFEYKAKLAIAADRRALAEQGYVIVKKEHSHVPGGWNCGDTTDAQGNCVSLRDGDYGQWASMPCPCYCHEDQ